jgi:hypothetical protein
MATRNLFEDEPSYNIREFCKLENISDATYHNLKKRGYGPAEIRAPGMRLVRITAQARLEWHARMQKLASHPQVAADRRKLAAQTSKGGKVAAASPTHHCRVKARKAAARKVA